MLIRSLCGQRSYKEKAVYLPFLPELLVKLSPVPPPSSSQVISFMDAPQPQESTPPLGGSTSEAAKFKLWVKSKGFHLGPPPGHVDRGLPHTIDTLYLPTGTDKVGDFIHLE